MDSVKEASDAMPAKQAQQEEILASKPIPKPNLNATEAENVYPIGMLIPATDMRNLTVKEWQDANGEDLKLSSRFVAHRVNPIAVRDDVQRLKALKYLMLLLEFNLALKPAGKAGKKVPQKDQLRAKLQDWPETLIESVRRRFSDNNELNKWHMDNLITHMAAISLFVDGYKTDTHDLREDLRLENKQYVLIFIWTCFVMLIKSTECHNTLWSWAAKSTTLPKRNRPTSRFPTRQSLRNAGSPS